MKRVVFSGQPLSSREVGGKFAKQAAMAAAGIAVPPFYVLTTAVFEEVVAGLRAPIEAALAEIDWEDGASVRAAAGAIRALFVGLELPQRIADEALAHFASLDAERVSVRASMVAEKAEESEDSATHPFAGVSESFLFVRREDLLDKLKQVWASGFSQEALLYRHAHGMDLLAFAVAAGVQRMVAAERSFVLFTCDPKTAARDTVIVAAYGLGEGVVQERAPCDHYFLAGKRAPGEPAVHQELAHKDVRLVLDQAAGQGLVEEPVPPELRDVACLDEETLLRLEALGKQVQELFGEPVDVEGCLLGDEIYLLQARPIAFDYRRMRVWTNNNVTESFPGVTTALTYSFARYFYQVIFADCYRRLGVPERELQANWSALERMIGFLEGRVYYCLSSFYRLHQQSPLFPLFEGSWVAMMGFRASYQTDASAFSRWTKAGLAAIKFLWGYATHRRSVRRFHEWWERSFGPYRAQSFAGEDALLLSDRFHDLWAEVGQEWGVTLLNDTYLPLIYDVVESRLKAWGLSEQDPALLSDLLCGGEPLVSVEIVLSAVRLAERVRADPSLRERFARDEPEALWAAHEAGELEAGFSEGVREHLFRWGDRGLQELEIEQPSLRMQPVSLIRSIKAYANQDVSVAGLRAAEEERRRDGERRLKQALGFAPLRRLLLGWALPALRRMVRNRENSRYCRSELFGFSRQVFLAIGQHLVDAGALRELDDVYHLGMNEVFGYVDGTGITDDLQALADLRRGEAAAHEEQRLRRDITTLGPLRQNSLIERGSLVVGEGELLGLGSSPGKVVGTARVVIDPTVPLPETEDLILVARETDPGWMFLMLASKGMVVERGSMLSHTAITGRKFGIPTVVAVPGATERIPDGARVELDGALGVVRVLEEAASE